MINKLKQMRETRHRQKLICIIYKELLEINEINSPMGECGKDKTVNSNWDEMDF